MGRGKQEHRGTANLRRRGGTSPTTRSGVAPKSASGLSIQRRLITDLDETGKALRVTEELEVVLADSGTPVERQGQLIREMMRSLTGSVGRVYDANRDVLERIPYDTDSASPEDAGLVKAGLVTEADISKVGKMEALGKVFEGRDYTGGFGDHLRRVRERGSYMKRCQREAYARYCEAIRTNDLEGARLEMGKMATCFGRRVACVMGYFIWGGAAAGGHLKNLLALPMDLLGALTSDSKGLEVPQLA